MNLREQQEQLEHQILSPRACFSDQSRGREKPISDDDLRTCFQRDIDRIVHSKSFRRLKHKTQVFLQPEGDHYRTRMTHTLEVSRVARTISRALRLNEDLTEAIALGHDLGHTPFGHAGEKVLRKIYSEGFEHNEQSLRVVDILERDGKGLNLTYEVRMGMVGHTGPIIPETLEGQVVRLSDKIAYINHDIDDAIRAGILSNDDIPKHISSVIGGTHGDRIDSMVRDVIQASADSDSIIMNPPMAELTDELHEFMFENVYRNPIAKSEEAKTPAIIEMLFNYYVKHQEELPPEILSLDESEERRAVDYIACMTDTYAINKFKDLFIPKGWQSK